MGRQLAGLLYGVAVIAALKALRHPKSSATRLFPPIERAQGWWPQSRNSGR